MARPHHVREGEQRGQKCVVGADRLGDERAVCLGDAHRFGLRSISLTRAEVPSMNARGVEPFAAERAGAIRVGKRRDDEIADLDGAHLGADGVGEFESVECPATDG